MSEPEICYMCGTKDCTHYIRRYCRHCGSIKYWMACRVHGEEFRASHERTNAKNPGKTGLCPDCKELCPDPEFWVVYENKGLE